MTRLALLLSLSLATPCWAAVNFDAVDDIVNCLSPTAFDNMAALTVAAWINPVSEGENTFGRIVDKAGAGGGVGWVFFTNQNGFSNEFDGIRVIVDYSTTDLSVDCTAGNCITLNTWQHVAITWDGGAESDNAILYVNGVAPTMARTDGVGTRVDDNASNLEIGNRANADRTFDGLITDVVIINAVLSATQIAQLASSRVKRVPLQIQSANLIGYFLFDDQPHGASADGDTFINAVGSGNNCTGNDGADNTGLTWTADFQSYP